MAVDECCGSVVFAEQAAVDVVEPIPGDEPVPAGGTCETLWWGERTDHNQAEYSILLCNNTLERTHMLVKTDIHALLHDCVCRCWRWVKVEN